MNPKSKPLADIGAIVEVAIDEIGSRGDGIGTWKDAPVFVPFAAPGDRLKVRLGATREKGRTAEIVEIMAPGPMRGVPACRHFGLCGGCALQHLTDDSYAAWKVDLVRAALSHRGFEDVEVGALIRTLARSRRRANLKAICRGGEVSLGFYERASHRVVDVMECPVLLPDIEEFIPPLRALLQELLRAGEQAEIDVTAAASGLDVTIAAGFDAHMKTRTILAQFGEEQDLARVNWLARDKDTPEPIVIRRPVTLDFGGVSVDLPPRAFLQPSLTGEAALVERVTAACAGEKRVADLYSGCGTFSFPLARTARVHAFESDAALVAALNNAAKRANLAQKVTAETRDLDRRPLPASDLDNFDAVVFDPPRPGAKRQSEEIARSKVRRVVAVSCNPASFARDARILTDGGYRIESVTPLDQFLWSPHVEVIAVFRK
jgi:23S rRNA (uracil1939-C5)-methyltransferase